MFKSLALALILAVLSIPLAPTMGMTVFAGGLLGGDLVLTVHDLDAVADSAQIERLIEGMGDPSVSLSSADESILLTVMAGGLLGSLLAAVLCGLVLTFVQALLAKVMYGSTVRTKAYLRPTLLLNSVYALSCLSFVVLLAQNSFSFAIFFARFHAVGTLIVPGIAYALVCILQHRINLKETPR